MKIDLHIMAKAAQVAVKTNPTQAVTEGVHALHSLRSALAPALNRGLPRPSAIGNAATLEALSRMPGHAFGIKSGGLADRPYMHESRQRASQGAKSIFDKMKAQVTPENAMNYGLPGVFGAISGAEQVPENRWLGALGGGGGAMGGSFLGAAAARNMGGERIGQYIGRLIGASMGQDVGVRGARLLAT